MNNSGNVTFILENLGKILLSFAYQWLIDYDNEQVCFWIVKNLGKLNPDDIVLIWNIFTKMIKVLLLGVRRFPQ